MIPSLDSLFSECHDRGVAVVSAYLPRGMRGAYRHRTRTIVLCPGMPGWMAVPTLLHGMVHAERGDDGPQPAAVEARIDALVACQLITVGEYATAERAVGPGVGALAMELETTTWVIEAYQRCLLLNRLQ